MSSSSPSWTVYAGQFPYHVDVNSVYDMMAKFKPVKAQYDAAVRKTVSCAPFLLSMHAY